VEAFQEIGAHVVGWDVAPRGEQSIEVDVSDAASVAAGTTRTEGELGGLDVLVNSAGVFELGTAAEIDIARWHHHLDVNLTGSFLVSRALLPLLRASSGAIVNIASIAGVVAFPRNAGYSASKGGVVMLTRSMALDFAGDGVRVNCVCPYSVEGPMMDRYFAAQADSDASRAALAAATPLGRLARPDEIARAVRFLASSDASYITGVALPVDGGYSAK
jgi:NAD(P)-dependent dehydrogenase (short-subunit alcohol dehydrogenase family)